MFGLSMEAVGIILFYCFIVHTDIRLFPLIGNIVLLPLYIPSISIQ